METKKCAKCCETKQLKDFQKVNITNDNYSFWCIDCSSKKNSERFKNRKFKSVNDCAKLLKNNSYFCDQCVYRTKVVGSMLAHINTKKHLRHINKLQKDKSYMTSIINSIDDFMSIENSDLSQLKEVQQSIEDKYK